MAFSLFAVGVLILLALLGAAAGAHALLGAALPSLAFLLFLAGVIYRMLKWARSPVPFRIPTTCGQQKSLSWIPSSPLENPHGTCGVIGRMALEVLLFRSLFRNTKAELGGAKLAFGGAKWLWAAGLALHWSFLLILLRHLRFFLEPVPAAVNLVSALDGFFELAVPTLYLTDAVLLVSLTYLFLRRIFIPQVRYISLAADYFPLLLILAIAVTGLLMRHVWRVDLFKVKELALSLAALHPHVPEGLGAIFYLHLFLVSALLVYFPLSKLVHMGGVFLSPTRNLANNSRRRRHINPWNSPARVHTYEEYEDEFREKMKAAGLPVEKE